MCCNQSRWLMVAAGFSLLGALPALAQLPTCTAPAWSSCDLSFDLEPGDIPVNPSAVELRAEFRSPRARTVALSGFRDGDRRWTIRFAPTEEGPWDYRVTSNVKRLDGQEGRVTAAASDAPGFVRVANVHHFATESIVSSSDVNANRQPHLWMGTEVANFAKLPRAEFTRIVEQRAKDKFTHLRVTIDAAPGRGDDLREAADRVREINSRGMVADIVLVCHPCGSRTKNDGI